MELDLLNKREEIRKKSLEPAKNANFFNKKACLSQYITNDKQLEEQDADPSLPYFIDSSVQIEPNFKYPKKQEAVFQKQEPAPQP